MITNRFISVVLIVFSFLLFFSYDFSSGAEDSTKKSVPLFERRTETGKNPTTGDTVYVIHFHPTAQCSCCINVGNFSHKSLKRFYAKPYRDGEIVFKECNIDEDTLTAKKYQIFWSALGFMKSSKDQNEFKEIESVWEFCEDEDKFLPNFKTELDRFLREDKRGADSTTTKNKTTVP